MVGLLLSGIQCIRTYIWLRVIQHLTLIIEYKIRQICLILNWLDIAIKKLKHFASNVLMLCCREVPLVEPEWGTPLCSNGRRTITTTIIINKPVRREVSFFARLCSDISCTSFEFCTCPAGSRDGVLGTPTTLRPGRARNLVVDVINVLSIYGKFLLRCWQNMIVFGCNIQRVS